MMTRREALKSTALAAAAFAVVPGALAQTTPAGGGSAFLLPALPYAYDALEPYLDAQTMQIHHDKHHAAYVANLNKAVAEAPNLATMDVESLLKNLESAPEKVRLAVRNNAGGHYNHTVFWQMMKKDGGGEPGGELAREIERAFGSYAAFKDKFTEAATKVFGSGWAWLTLEGNVLKIESTGNQDSPLSAGRMPLLGLDVWEHAYYLKYQNKRADYIAAWWNVVSWDYASDRFAKARA
jgi:Fe-Mn family superoxide dismutase